MSSITAPNLEGSFSVSPLSPRRNSSEATNELEAISEQIRHAGIDENSELGLVLANTIKDIYHCHDHVNQMWNLAQRGMQDLDQGDSIALFSATPVIARTATYICLYGVDPPTDRLERSLSLKRRLRCVTRRPVSRRDPVFARTSCMASPANIFSANRVFILSSPNAWMNWTSHPCQGAKSGGKVSGNPGMGL